MSVSLDRRPVIIGDSEGLGMARTAFAKAIDPRIVPEGKQLPDFSTARPEVILATLIDHVIDATRIRPDALDFVLCGTANAEASTGMNIARMATLASKYREAMISIPGITTNAFCTSATLAACNAADSIMAGSADAIMITGIEMMSHTPMGGWNTQLPMSIMPDFDEGWLHMGRTAETLARELGISRAEQEDFATLSQWRAAHPDHRAITSRNIVTIPGFEDVIEDQNIRIKFKRDKKTDELVDSSRAYRRLLSRLKPSFDDAGTVTPATSAPLTDGAVAWLMTSADFARINGLPILAEICGHATRGCDPARMGLGPIFSTERLLSKTGRKMEDLGPIEANEAFAPQVIAFNRHFGLENDRVNQWGGALAYGHPLAGSGPRGTWFAAQQLARNMFPDKDHALFTQCAGGGSGTSVLLKRFEP